MSTLPSHEENTSSYTKHAAAHILEREEHGHFVDAFLKNVAATLSQPGLRYTGDGGVDIADESTEARFHKSVANHIQGLEIFDKNGEHKKKGEPQDVALRIRKARCLLGQSNRAYLQMGVHLLWHRTTTRLWALTLTSPSRCTRRPTARRERRAYLDWQEVVRKTVMQKAQDTTSAQALAQWEEIKKDESLQGLATHAQGVFEIHVVVR